MTMKQIVRALVVGAVLAGAGYLVGQYAPFTGIASICQPFSPCRNETALGYMVVAGVIGLVLGGWEMGQGASNPSGPTPNRDSTGPAS